MLLEPDTRDLQSRGAGTSEPGICPGKGFGVLEGKRGVGKLGEAAKGPRLLHVGALVGVRRLKVRGFRGGSVGTRESQSSSPLPP